MLHSAKIEKFYNDVKGLDIRFPVATIAKATGYGEPNVSEYIRGKKTPSESFLKAFYDWFEKLPRETRIEEPETAYTRNKEDMIFDELSKIRQSNDKLIDQQGILVETNKKLADKLLSINSNDQQEMARAAILESLVDLIVKIGVDAGTWKDRNKGLEAAGKMLSGKIQESSKMNKNGA